MSSDETDLIARLRCLDACALSDSLDAMGLPGATLGLRPLWAGPAICGRAITVQIGPKGDAKPTVHLNTTAIETGGPGKVIVVSNSGREDVSCWGDILSVAATEKGLEGVVIDGACRDIAESAQIGFPVYGRAVVPVSARNRIIQYSMNERVTMAGVSVYADDFVFADASGTVFIPQAVAGEVIERTERLVAKQDAMIKAIRAGRSVVDVMHDKEFDKALKGGASQ